MNSRIMPTANIIDRIITSGQFIGIFISGSFLPLVVFFARFNIISIRIPVNPPDITPPIPKISVNPMNSNLVAIT